jgi:FixJ family two-component response regulator
MPMVPNDFKAGRLQYLLVGFRTWRRKCWTSKGCGGTIDDRLLFRAVRPVAMTRTVLVLDDEVWVATSVVDTLAEFGLRVAGPFRSNATALSYLADHTPDFNVADGTSGRTAERLNELRTPFLVISGSPKESCKGTEFRSAAWLDKPFGEAALIAHISRLLTHKLHKAPSSIVSPDLHPER